MDEVLEVVDVAADLGLEGAFAWILRIVGLLAIVGGLGLWLFTDMGVLVLPALLMAGGLVLVVAPSILLLLVEVT